jgi:1-acyl-sn-glycerol-3-phosphate acyltransferase
MTIIKQIIILIIIIIIGNILIFIHCLTKGMPGFTSYVNNLINMKTKTVNTKNINNFTKDKLIIMCNHMNGTDYIPIAQIFNKLNKNKKLYTIVSSKLVTSPANKNTITNIINIFDKSFFKFCNFIKYTKGNKESGLEVRQKILEVINNNNTLLVFPEGVVTRKGIPESFKPGSFEICKENSISILPISIKYNKKLGINSDENVNFLDWFNTEATLYIHDIINPDDYKTVDDIMQKTLDIIRKPLID